MDGQSALWLEVRATPENSFKTGLPLKGIHEGEKAIITLASAIGADLLLMDDRNGVRTARNKGQGVTGTLGILELAADKGLTGFTEVVERLRRTNFRCPEVVLARV